jgi:integrase
LIPSNPIQGMERPQAQSRDVYLAPAQWDRFRAAARRDQALLDFAVVLKATGCRPQELRAAEARHFDRAQGCLVLEKGVMGADGREGVKGKRAERVIQLEGEALAIVQRRALKYRDGKLFRNRREQPWTGNAIVQAFQECSTKLGFPITSYTLRHTFITDALVAGIDPVTVATLVDHSDLSMITRVYNKLRKRGDHLKRALAKINGRQPDSAESEAG